MIYVSDQDGCTLEFCSNWPAIDFRPNKQNKMN